MGRRASHGGRLQTRAKDAGDRKVLGVGARQAEWRKDLRSVVFSNHNPMLRNLGRGSVADRRMLGL